jgi:hypothetical protein
VDTSRSAIQKASLTLQSWLLQVISDTRGHVEMKYAQTAEEQDKDLEEREESGNEESEDEDEQVYNPLNLPMGPDGKPIPYWLYKLHGLNQVRNWFVISQYLRDGSCSYFTQFWRLLNMRLFWRRQGASSLSALVCRRTFHK